MRRNSHWTDSNSPIFSIVIILATYRIVVTVRIRKAIVKNITVRISYVFSSRKSDCHLLISLRRWMRNPTPIQRPKKQVVT